MKDISITASSRQAGGKGMARRTRGAGNIPGVVYGPEVKPMSITLSEREFRNALKTAGGTHGSIFTLNVDGQASKVIVREVQRDPITSRLIHVDFHAISMNKPIKIEIPINLTGISKGVKSEGGIMQILMRDLEISCLPVNIPEHFEIDVSELGIGDSIHVRNLSIPNVDILSEPSNVVVVIVAPTIIKAEATTAEAALAAEGEAAEGAPAAGAAPAEAGKEGKEAPGKKEAAGKKEEPKKEGKKEEKKGK
jgi:large subunit ribosomal protein L25